MSQKPLVVRDTGVSTCTCVNSSKWMLLRHSAYASRSDRRMAGKYFSTSRW
jgi:hypothetical protein